ncbi:hypothetical protein Tco_1346022 [Tanacetum coccineum]
MRGPYSCACEVGICSWRDSRVDGRSYLLSGATNSSEANGIIRNPKKKGGVRVAREDDRGDTKGREDVHKAFQQRRSYLDVVESIDKIEEMDVGGGGKIKMSKAKNVVKHKSCVVGLTSVKEVESGFILAIEEAYTIKYSIPSLKRLDQISVGSDWGTPTHWIGIQRISLTGFPAQSVGSSNTDVLDLPCLLVLITGTSQSRQHVDTSLIHIESRKSPTKSLFDAGSSRISIFISRWMKLFSEYGFKAKYHLGKENVVVESWSRKKSEAKNEFWIDV